MLFPLFERPFKISILVKELALNLGCLFPEAVKNSLSDFLTRFRAFTVRLTVPGAPTKLFVAHSILHYFCQAMAGNLDVATGEVADQGVRPT
jgi:hypothetical protein